MKYRQVANGNYKTLGDHQTSIFLCKPFFQSDKQLVLKIGIHVIEVVSKYNILYGDFDKQAYKTLGKAAKILQKSWSILSRDMQ